MTSLEPIAQGVFWSMMVNIAGYLWGSVNRPQTPLEHNQAILFVDVFSFSRTSENSVVWRGKVLLSELHTLLSTFFGMERANRAINRYTTRNNLPDKGKYADARLVMHSEKVLAGAIGTASARTLVASIAKEEAVSMDEVIRILKSSQELISVNKKLKRKSTELEQITTQLSEANERLKAADAHKDDFLSTITHEIRTPITSIRALTEIMHDTPDMDVDARQNFLKTVIKESERLTRLINQVLDLERIESGLYTLTLEPLRLSDLVQEAIDLLEPIAAEKEIHIQFINEAEREGSVLGDRDRLLEVLINLLSNAINYSDQRASPIVVQSFCEQQACVVSIRDKGIGIDPQFHELIFDKFYQTQSVHDLGTQTANKPNTRQPPKGSGLGLAISRQIVHLHNGIISVESRPEQGSCFTFRIPIS